MTLSNIGRDPSAGAALYALGGAEAVVAEATIALDEQAERSKDVQRQAERAQRDAARDRISHLRDKADAERWAGIVSGAGQIGSGACGVAGEGDLGTIIEGGGKVGAAFLGYDASQADIEAQRAGMREASMRSQAEELGDQADAAERRRDRAMGQLDAIAKARMEGRLTASRG